jgi:hypothetical protein
LSELVFCNDFGKTLLDLEGLLHVGGPDCGTLAALPGFPLEDDENQARLWARLERVGSV